MYNKVDIFNKVTWEYCEASVDIKKIKWTNNLMCIFTLLPICDSYDRIIGITNIIVTLYKYLKISMIHTVTFLYHNSQLYDNVLLVPNDNNHTHLFRVGLLSYRESYSRAWQIKLIGSKGEQEICLHAATLWNHIKDGSLLCNMQFEPAWRTRAHAHTHLALIALCFISLFDEWGSPSPSQPDVMTMVSLTTQGAIQLLLSSIWEQLHQPQWLESCTYWSWYKSLSCQTNIFTSQD